MFKAIIAVPGTNGKKRKTRLFKTRDLSKAIELKLEFERGLKSTDYQSTDVHIIQKEAKPELLIECMAMYIGYLNNVGVEAHKVKVRTQKHINETEYYFEKLCKCLLKNRIDHTFFKVDQLNDRIVALFHSYLIENLNYANKTYNKIIGLFRQFLNWLILKKGYNIENPFVDVARRRENVNKTILTSDEFDVLLKTIKPEHGYKKLPSGERKNQYRDWLSDCFKLALETGLRREEFMTLKYSDILCDEEGLPQFFVVENFKVNRIKGLDSETGEKKFVPITQGLMNLLTSIGYEKYKDTDHYIIGAEERSSRNTLIGFVSKAFTHYWKLTGIEKNVQLKHLRKTYLTSLVEHFGDKAPVISNHSGIDVLKKHYVNDKQLASAAKNFSVFKTKEEK
jgi:integrase